MPAAPAEPPAAPVLADDGTPLPKKLARAMLVRRLRAAGLVAPLLAFLLAAFIVPVGAFLGQGVHDDTYAAHMPESAPLLQAWDAASPPPEALAGALVRDLIAARAARTIGRVATRLNRQRAGLRSLLTSTARKARRLQAPYLPALAALHRGWSEPETWRALKVAAAPYTPAYLAVALDFRYEADGGFRRQDEGRRIHLPLLLRTLWISLLVTLACLALGYPVAYLLAGLPPARANLLLILVLLPFWTSILARTTSWIAMLQGEGVLNDLFVTFGLTADAERFSMIYNRTGTLVAMTHILLPFMVLPLYSMMRSIPPAYVRAAKSLGATPWTAFWRVYAPQTVPGIGAGAMLVFLLAIGYYITPALVGGQDGQMISNLIDFHMRSSLNWPLAAALGAVLLAVVLFFYWLFDRLVGVERMRFH